MKRAGEYKLFEVIQEDFLSTVYRGRGPSGSTCLVRVLKSQVLSNSEMAQLRYAAKSAAKLSVPGIIRPLDFFDAEGTSCIVSEDFGGMPFASERKGFSISINIFLVYAKQLAETLGEMHRARTRHNLLNFDSIYFSAKDIEAKITHFSTESTADLLLEASYEPDVIRRILPYLSPEQTGRMNRIADYRSDFYSLGVVLYELLTGVPPFCSEDPLEIFHGHIARRPMPVVELNENVPEVLSKIIDKLLKKNAAERYQNGYGLLHDLSYFEKQWQIDEKPKMFPLGSKDISVQFVLPKTLVGREAEIGVIKDAFFRVCAGPSEALIVKGHAGVGKTAIIREINKHIVVKRGYFISESFDKLERGSDHNTLLKIFRHFADYMLHQPRSVVQRWKSRLAVVLGENVKEIIEILPEFEALFDSREYAKTRTSQSSDDVKRLDRTLRQFIKAMASKENPVVIALDDLHWADNTSLEIIKDAILDVDVEHVLWVLSYRSGEINQSHPLTTILNDLSQVRLPLKEIEVEPLSLEQTAAYAQEALLKDRNQVRELASLLHRKTGGNPFFLGQFLLSLYENNCVQMVEGAGWNWDLRQISEMRSADNVVNLLMDKIGGLDEHIRQILHVASCIGVRFRPTTLAIVTEEKIDDVLDKLARAIQDGFLGKTKDEYYFVHDRVHEAVYSFVPEELRLRTHYRIGILLWAPTPPDELEGAVFEIVNQLNLAKKYFEQTDERLEIAKLNLLAGKKAKAAALYTSALKYLETGIEFLGEKRWTSEYQLHIELNEEALEAAYLAKEHSRMRSFAEVVVARAKSPMEKVKTFELLIQSAHAERGPQEAIEYGLFALEELGVRLPARWLRWNAHRRFVKLRRKMRRLKREQVLSLPKVRNPEKRAILRILNRMSLPAFFVSPYLWQILTLEHLDYALKYGILNGTAAALSAFASVFSTLPGKVETASFYGQLSLELAEKHGDEESRAGTLLNFYALIQHWNRHLAQDLDAVMEVADRSFGIGAFHLAASLISIWETHSIIAGRELRRLEKELEESGRKIASMGQSIHILTNLASKQFVHNLIYKKDDPSRQRGLYYDNEEMGSFLSETGNRLGSSVTNAYEIMLNCIYGQFEAAIECAEVSKKSRDYAKAFHLLCVAQFYSAVAYLKSALTMQESYKRGRHLRKGERILYRLKEWSQSAGENYSHRVRLIEALLAECRGASAPALVLYEEAARLAQEYGYIQEAGLAYEFSADALCSTGHRRLAKVFLENARSCYRKWGAFGKVDALEDRYPTLLTKEIEQTEQTAFKQIDYQFVVEALQDISKEIELSKLLERVIKTLSSVSGANKVQLFMVREDKLLLEAEQSLTQGDTIRVGTRELPEADETFLSVIQYVRRTKEPVVIDSAIDEPNYHNDPYVVFRKVRSVLCLPVIRQEGLLGIIYLENRFTEGAFTPERIEALELLASQAASSVENARLYNDVLDSEKKSRELSHSLAKANEELEKTLEMFIESEQRLSTVLNGANLGLWDYNNQTGVILFNERFAEMHDLSQNSMTMEASDFVQIVHPDDVPKLYPLFGSKVSDSERGIDFEYRGKTEDGWRWILCRGQITTRDEQNKPLRATGILLDIDPRKKTEERRSQLQNQFLQQQKIESIGQLTGGIAHDLNNLITPILGYADLIKEDLAGEPLLCEEVDEIKYAGQRARDLIKQLLAFGRKQMLEWKIVDIQDVILEFRGVLGGVVREDIELEIATNNQRKMMRCDPAQIQQVLLNLVANARDAMPDGGKIRIDVSCRELEKPAPEREGNREPGKYVVLNVEDNGLGMDASTLKRIFEPFFTTKEVGKGSGLGLSTVYGIIKQHSGYVDVHSEVGIGTTFSMKFPLFEQV